MWARGDVGHHVVAVLDGAAVDGDDDVVRLQAGLGSAAARYDRRDHDTGREAIHATDSGGLTGLELDADGAAGDLVVWPDEHVVDVDESVRRHGEADAL